VSFKASLNLRSAVSVLRTTTSNDGMGGQTTTTVTTIIPRAALWQAGSNDAFLSDAVKAVSTHVLACVPTDIVSTDTVSYDGVSYEIAGQPDDVLAKGRAMFVPLKRVD
jgi:hypothetical protein